MTDILQCACIVVLTLITLSGCQPTDQVVVEKTRSEWSDEVVAASTSQPRDQAVEAVAPPDTVEEPPTRTYTVQADDQSYWAVAETVYGDGQYFYLIVAANPGADSRQPPVGQTLVIPPLPPGAAPQEAPIQTPADQTPPEVLPGHTVYTVVEGDRGFWGIAVKVYGAGKYWPLIAQANPDVAPARLTPGQELIMPPMPHGDD